MSGEISAGALAEQLAALIQCPTIAGSEAEPLDEAGLAPFRRLQDLLREFYPATFAAAEVSEVGVAGLLLRVAGTGGAGAVATGLWGGPWVLMAHQDVVPAPRDDEDWASAGWSYPPFAGVIAPDASGATAIYGRGALDDKGDLVAVLAAVESLLAEGWRPPQDLYLLLGGDEERDGPSAVAAVAELRARGVRPFLVLDEGGAVALGAFPGLSVPAAVIGVAEKGVVELEIVVAADPTRAGHASTPPKRSATAALGRAIAALEAQPHSAVVDDVTVALLETLAPHLGGPIGKIAGRAGSARRLAAAGLARLGPETAALVRTTTTVTQLSGSAAANVIAARASAIVNMRVRPGQSVADAVAHVERVVRRAVYGRSLGPLGGRGARGLAVTVEIISETEATGASPLDLRWDAIVAAVGVAYPGAVVVPYTMLAASDSRHVAPIAEGVYRFAPLEMTAQQRASIHGVDEYVTAESLRRGVAFYRALLLAE